ncbi:MAG: alanyl-tRNA editing protein [Clostridia bacterium]|jgi:misacylated tRNA(Ala) deacylase
MELVYQSDAYRRILDTEVIAVETLEVPPKADGTGSADGTSGGLQHGVQFASTIIYPGGGGQHPDHGSFQVLDGGTAAPGMSQPITGVFKDGNELWYLTGKTAPLPGTAVRLAIDWQRRYDLMRTHTAMHILIGVIWRDYRKLVTGSNMELLKARLDFEFEGLGPSLLAEIEKRCTIEVAAARPVQVTFAEADSSVEGLIRTKTNLVPHGIARLRFVDITGLDRQADGGTHVASTAEVGSIHITGFDNKGRNNKRIKMALDPAPAPD